MAVNPVSVLPEFFLERPIKPKRFPADTYPQDPRQKEDDLTSDQIIKGYQTPLNAHVVNDFAKSNKPFDQNKVGTSLSAILTLRTKHDQPTLNEKQKKAHGLGKDNFIFLPKSDPWFRDLANGVPLHQLVVKIPGQQKTNRIIRCLSEFNVPISRGVWYVKLLNVHYLLEKDNRRQGKKSSQVDPFVVWVKHFHDLIDELLSQPEHQSDLWTYLCRLLIGCLHENMLDLSEFAKCLLKLLDKYQASNSCLKLLVIDVICPASYVFTESCLFTQRLAFVVTKFLASLYPAFNRKDAQVTDANNQLYLALISLLHRLMVERPDAFVYCLTFDKSPLDGLPCGPSELPFVNDYSKRQLLPLLRSVEERIIERSLAVENSWRFEPYFDDIFNVIKLKANALLYLEPSLSPISGGNYASNIYKNLKFRHSLECLTTESAYAQAHDSYRLCTDDRTLIHFLFCWTIAQPSYCLDSSSGILVNVLNMYSDALEMKYPSSMHEVCAKALHSVITDLLHLFARNDCLELVDGKTTTVVIARVIHRILLAGCFSLDDYFAQMISYGYIDLLKNAQMASMSQQQLATDAAATGQGNTGSFFNYPAVSSVGGFAAPLSVAGADSSEHATPLIQQLPSIASNTSDQLQSPSLVNLGTGPSPSHFASSATNQKSTSGNSAQSKADAAAKEENRLKQLSIARWKYRLLEHLPLPYNRPCKDYINQRLSLLNQYLTSSSVSSTRTAIYRDLSRNFSKRHCINIATGKCKVRLKSQPLLAPTGTGTTGTAPNDYNQLTTRELIKRVTALDLHDQYAIGEQLANELTLLFAKVSDGRKVDYLPEMRSVEKLVLLLCGTKQSSNVVSLAVRCLKQWPRLTVCALDSADPIAGYTFPPNYFANLALLWTSILANQTPFIVSNSYSFRVQICDSLISFVESVLPFDGQQKPAVVDSLLPRQCIIQVVELISTLCVTCDKFKLEQQKKLLKVFPYLDVPLQNQPSRISRCYLNKAFLCQELAMPSRLVPWLSHDCRDVISSTEQFDAVTKILIGSEEHVYSLVSNVMLAVNNPCAKPVDVRAISEFFVQLCRHFHTQFVCFDGSESPLRYLGRFMLDAFYTVCQNDAKNDDTEDQQQFIDLLMTFEKNSSTGAHLTQFMTTLIGYGVIKLSDFLDYATGLISNFVTTLASSYSSSSNDVGCLVSLLPDTPVDDVASEAVTRGRSLGNIFGVNTMLNILLMCLDDQATLDSDVKLTPSVTEDQHDASVVRIFPPHLRMLLVHQSTNDIKLKPLVVLLRQLLMMHDMKLSSTDVTPEVVILGRKESLSKMAARLYRVLVTKQWIYDVILSSTEELFERDGPFLDTSNNGIMPKLILDSFVTFGATTGATTSTVKLLSEDKAYPAIIANLLQDITPFSLLSIFVRIHLLYRLAGHTLQTFLESFSECVINLFRFPANNGSGDGPDIVRSDYQKGFACRWVIAPLVSKLMDCVQKEVMKELIKCLELSVPNQSIVKMKDAPREKLLFALRQLKDRQFIFVIDWAAVYWSDQRPELLDKLKCQLDKLSSAGVAQTVQEQHLRVDAVRLRLSFFASLLPFVMKQWRIDALSTLSGSSSSSLMDATSSGSSRGQNRKVDALMGQYTKQTSSDGQPKPIEWVETLVGLVTSGMVTIDDDESIFNAVYDILANFVTTSLTLSSVEPPSVDQFVGMLDDERNVHYTALVRKIAKEVDAATSKAVPSASASLNTSCEIMAHKHSLPPIDYSAQSSCDEHLLRSLLPLHRKYCQIKRFEHYGTIRDYNGVITTFSTTKPGLQLASIEEVDPWMMIEGLEKLVPGQQPLKWGWWNAGYKTFAEPPLPYHDMYHLRSRSDLQHCHLQGVTSIDDDDYFMKPIVVDDPTAVKEDALDSAGATPVKQSRVQPPLDTNNSYSMKQSRSQASHSINTKQHPVSTAPYPSQPLQQLQQQQQQHPMASMAIASAANTSLSMMNQHQHAMTQSGGMNPMTQPHIPSQYGAARAPTSNAAFLAQQHLQHVNLMQQQHHQQQQQSMVNSFSGGPPYGQASQLGAMSMRHTVPSASMMNSMNPFAPQPRPLGMPPAPTPDQSVYGQPFQHQYMQQHPRQMMQPQFYPRPQ